MRCGRSIIYAKCNRKILGGWAFYRILASGVSMFLGNSDRRPTGFAFDVETAVVFDINFARPPQFILRCKMGLLDFGY